MKEKNGAFSRILEKLKPISFFLLVMAILTGFGLATFVLPAREFSPNENRELAQLPVVNGDTVLSGDFQKDLADFLSDQVPGRDFWIMTNTAVKKLQGKLEINGVYFGADGYYFQKFTDESFELKRISAVFSLIEQFAGKQQVPVNLMIVPTPGAVLSEKLPANAPFYDADKMWQQLQSATPSCGFIDLRETFDAAQEQLYYRTDHHWTVYGAYEAYEAYCAALGITAKPMADFGMEQVSDDFYGTIYSKTLDAAAKPDVIHAPQNLPKVTVTVDGATVKESVYAPEYLEQKDQYAYFFGGNFGTVEIKTEAGNGKHLLLIKDSFANSFVPYLLEEYETITMVDLRYFSGNVTMLAQQCGATEVLFLYEMTNLLTDNGINKLAR